MLDKYQQEIVDSKEPRIIVEAGAGSGKALLNGSKVVTPQGYVNIENLKNGDEIFGIDGNIYNVLGVFPQGKKEIYEVVFSDGAIVKCSKDHLWTFQTRSMRSHKNINFKTETLEEIIKKYKLFEHDKRGYKPKNIYVPLNSALKFAKKELPIKPYTLGALLGNGLLEKRGKSCVFSSNDQYCIDKVNKELCEINYTLKYNSKYDYRLSQIKQYKSSNLITILEELELSGKHSWEKFIPQIYLQSNIEDRLELARGLMDTDGYYKNGFYEYVTVSKQLAEDVKFLVQSLGCVAKIKVKSSPKYTYNNEERAGRTAYRVYIKCPKEIPLIHSSPKKGTIVNQQCYARKAIIDIRETKEYGEMTCIKTSAPDELFLTNDFTTTHNTRVLTERVKRLLQDGIDPSNIVVISFTNMAAEELKERLKDVPGIGDCFVGTIHSFANKIFKNSNEEYRLYTDEIENQFMTVLTNIHAKHLTMDKYFIYKDLVKQIDLGTKTDVDLHAMLKDEEIYEAKVLLGEIDNDDYKETVKTLCKRYNVISFDELLKRTTEYFKEINGKVEYLFVDEFQDIGKLEKDFFVALNADNYFYVGDEKQSLYAFKGGNVKFFTNLINNPKWKAYYLKNNYRSGSQIIELATRVIVQADDIINASSMCMSNKSGNVVIDSKLNLNRYLKQMSDFKDWFILVRTNKDLVKIETDLVNNNIPYVSFRKGAMSLDELNKCLEEDKVKLLTIHTSKGLESKNVLMWGNFPIKQKPYLRNSDEIKVEYVGITRAIDNLILLN